jgi:hypothetical protein
LPWQMVKAVALEIDISMDQELDANGSQAHCSEFIVS